MAFVNRAQRNIKLNIEESNEVGPGQYYNEPSLSLDMSNHAPFNTNSSRPDPYKISDSNLGPGSYETTNTIAKNASGNYVKPIERSLYKAVESEVISPLLLKSIENSQRIGFSTKTQRFSSVNNQKDDSQPGPGDYLVSTSFGPKHKKKKPKFHFNESLTTCSPNRVSSIPSKEMYGYEFIDGIPFLIPDPNGCLKTSGEKLNKIGPGHYDLSPKWNHKGVKWNSLSHNLNIHSLSTNRNDDTNRLSSTVSTLISNDNITARTSIDNNNLNTSKLDNSKRSLIFKNMMEKRNKLYQPKQNTVSDLLFEGGPGPGYYAKEYNDLLKGSMTTKFSQSFGVKSPRFSQKEKEDYINYKEKMRTKPKKIAFQTGHFFTEEMSNLQKISFLSRGLYKIDTDNLVGPGSYEISKSPIKNICKGKHFEDFGSKERRFEEKESDLPGPGTYFTKDKETEHTSLSKMIYTQPSPIISKEQSTPIIKDISPPVGTYNPSIVSSMNYKILSHINQFQNHKKVSFGSQEKRFDSIVEKKNKENSILGPGLYFKSNLSDSIQAQSNTVSLNQKEKRFDYRIKEPYRPAPGSYELSNFHDWNKKSHNILFI